jgi:hypothetical protein
MRSFLSRAVSPMFALALVAFGACADRPDPTQIPAQLEPNALINEDGGGGGDEPDPLTPYISSLSVNNTTLAIGVSSSGSYTALLRNPGWTRDPVVMATFIRQGTATRAAGTRAVHCGDAPSVLPNGFCTDGGLLSASNTAGGTGTLVPGPASFEVRLKVGTTVVATRSVAVTLIYPPPVVTSVGQLPDTILVPTILYRPFSFTMMNPGRQQMTRGTTTPFSMPGEQQSAEASAAARAFESSADRFAIRLYRRARARTRRGCTLLAGIRSCLGPGRLRSAWSRRTRSYSAERGFL